LEGDLVCTAFETANEVAMKRYLLKPHRRREIARDRFFVVRGGIREIWPFVKDKYFIAIHFKYDPEGLLVNGEEDLGSFVEQSDIVLGLLFKRGNASIKSMLKFYKIQGAD